MMYTHRLIFTSLICVFILSDDTLFLFVKCGCIDYSGRLYVFAFFIVVVAGGGGDDA